MGAAGDIDRGQPILPCQDVVDVELGREANLKADRLEGRRAAEKIEAQAEVLRRGELLAASKEPGLVRRRRTRASGKRNTPGLEQRFAHAREVEERAATENRVIAFDPVPVERVEPSGGCINYVEARIVVPLPGRAREDLPAIRHLLGLHDL